ncbi:MAG: TIGR02253 family HAD-type hydrolase [Nanoarchaeota archaeon]|nr:TIGR02253 family HAD-type hydrolase [Nanoarchaeota archaeon]
MKAIIFDLDNTIMDFMKMKRGCTDAAISAMIKAGLNMNYEDASKKIFELYEEKGIEKQDIFEDLLMEVNGEMDYKILIKGVLAYRKVRDAYMECYPGVRRTLEKLKEKGLKLAIVSDAPSRQAWIRLCSLEIENFFDVVVAHEETGKFKPNKEPFEIALNKLGVSAEECVMVGDHPDRYVKGANSLGMVSVLAQYGQRFESEEKADHVIQKFEELLRIVE